MKPKKKNHRLRNLRLIKYGTNFGVYIALAVIGAIAGLPDGTSAVITKTGLNPNIYIPVIFALFGLGATMKDQLMSYFKLPKGVNTAIILFAVGLVGWLLSYWLMIITTVYLSLTLVDYLYLNPLIDKEIERRKNEALKKEVAEVNGN